MRRLAAILLILCLAMAPMGAEARGTLKRKIKALEERLYQIEEVIRRMGEGSGTVDKNTAVFVDSEAPAVGEAKLVKAGGGLSLHACDSIATWSVVSGTPTPTIALDQEDIYEGTGAVKISFTSDGTYVLKCTFASKDLSTYPFVTFWVKKIRPDFFSEGEIYVGQIKVSITDNGGERGPDAYTTFTRDYALRAFNISGYTAAERDAVTEVKFTIDVTLLEGHGSMLIDYVVAETPYADLESDDGLGVAHHSAPYVTNYSGTGSAATLAVPRKGEIKAVLIQRTDSAYRLHSWVPGGTAGDSYNVTGGSKSTTGITAVAEGSITLGTDNDVNAAGGTYGMIVFFKDKD